MPIYEYDCPACGKPFEALVYGREQPCCPACGATNVAKRLSTFAVTSGAPEAPPPGACGSCGDPRGPGSCAR
jgi:putative FmdB family regulatory protein